MGRVGASLAERLVLVVVALHAVLLPLLFSRLDFIVRTSHTEAFINHVRSYSHHLVDELEASDVLDSPQRTVAYLDSVALDGEVHYAQVETAGRVLSSSVTPVASNAVAHVEDFAFGANGDDLYYLSLQINHRGGASVLRLGFDEAPTREQIELSRRQLAVALAVYLAIALSLAAIFGRQLARPLADLRVASRRVASGDVSQRLTARSGIAEIRDLAADLETMRQEIVGVGERLQRQMDERAALELRLRQRQKLETVGTLAGGVAHEFNNVLVPILLHTELALEEVANGRPCRDDLECVLDAARRAKRVIDKILAFSRQAGSEEPRPIRLDEPVAAALRLFAVLAPPNVEVRSSLAPDTPLVAADPTLITQAVMNLCTNGWQAMRETGGLLEVNLRALRADEPLPSDLPAGQYVELQVRDTGHGMDEQTRERIFEPFFTTREVGAGTGLGLSVVHGIVTSLGARIHVSSVVGQGTTFQILFPVVAAEPDTASTGVTDP